MINILLLFIDALLQLLSLLVIIFALLSFFVDPYHPVRRWISSVVEPLLTPIRRVMPPIAGLDFSPVVLLILIQILRNIIIRL